MTHQKLPEVVQMQQDYAKNDTVAESGDGNRDWKEDDASKIENLPFHERIIRAGRWHIYWRRYYWRRYWRREEERCVNLVAMQRMYMHFLQNKLLVEAAEIVKRESSTDSATIEATLGKVGDFLHRYCKFLIIAQKNIKSLTMLIVQARPSEIENTCESTRNGAIRIIRSYYHLKGY